MLCMMVALRNKGSEKDKAFSFLWTGQFAMVRYGDGDGTSHVITLMIIAISFSF